MAARAAAREAARPPKPDPHAGHHHHLIGTSVECSCGVFLGIISVVFGDDYDPDKLSCSICGRRGVVALP
jgi:hypothetical protein